MTSEGVSLLSGDSTATGPAPTPALPHEGEGAEGRSVAGPPLILSLSKDEVLSDGAIGRPSTGSGRGSG